MENAATILMVDDNDVLRYTLSQALRSGGYVVIEARNGTEALRLAGESPDLIALDLNLPDIDGLEVCRQLKSNLETAHIPVLHISAAFGDPQHRLRGLDGGADAYLAEPISADELLATVGALLRMKHAEREARLQSTEAEKSRQELKAAHDDLEARVHQTAELAEKNEEIRELTGRLLKSQDDERRRLARELHDSTGQMLAAMKMNLDLMSSSLKGQDAKVHKIFTETMEIADEMSRQLRTLSYLLHPPLLDETGLRSALQWYTDGFAQRSGIAVNLEISPEFSRLPHDLEIAIFRVVQESLTNIHRHSGSSNASIKLVQNDRTLVLEINDPGPMKNGARSEGNFVPGVGIMGMQERIRQFGGQFDITANTHGTMVRAIVPVKAATGEAH